MWWQQQQKKKVHQKFDDFRNCSNGSPNLLMKQYHSTVVKKKRLLHLHTVHIENTVLCVLTK